MWATLVLSTGLCSVSTGRGRGRWSEPAGVWEVQLVPWCWGAAACFVSGGVRGELLSRDNAWQPATKPLPSDLGPTPACCFGV